MLGIIGAMDVEVDEIKSKIHNNAIINIANIDFCVGTIEGIYVCVCQCGVGKVNSAIATQIMIDNFDLSYVVNVGVGCSLNSDVVIKNVVVASDVCQYDIDITALGEPLGFINGIDKVHVPTDKDLSKQLTDIAINCGNTVHNGTIASGDTFIASSELKNKLVDNFNAICGEMEGGSIGQTCYINHIPFAIIRSISDGGDSNSQIDYPQFKVIAAQITTNILIEFLKSSNVIF